MAKAKSKLGEFRSVKLTEERTISAILEDDLAEHGVDGYFDGDSIRIGTHLSKLSKQATYIHEAIHAISDVYGLGLDEVRVRVLEAGLMAFLGPYLKEIK